ncbi:hypothetical protein V501_08134, partial [Pseudogymnoascus sp. VKM F-4519 (FW-2642)]
MAVLSRKFNPGQDPEHFDPKTGHCSIEYYATCKDPYRAAANKIPVGWPWDVHKTSNVAVQLFDDLDESIREILSNHEINPRIISACSFAPRHTPKDKKAVSEIYEIVEPAAAAAGIEMGVEIRNEEKSYSDISYIIRDEATINFITKIQPFVLDAVMKHCPGKWTSIAYHYRGTQYYDCEDRLTAIIFIQPGAIHPWAELEEKISNTIISAISPEEIDISIEILPGRIALTRPSERSREYVYLSWLPAVPSNGSSIAPANCTDSAGTLGAVVNYRAADEEEDRRCFLTCYNVIATGDLFGKKTNDSLGIGLDGRQVEYKIDVEYPAKYDVRPTKVARISCIENGNATEEDFEILNRLEQLASQGPIGHVKFASGYRVSDTKHRMDWALIELDTTHPLKNLLPPETQFRRHGSPYYRVQEGDTVSGTTTSFRSEWYGKVGRSSQCTGAEHSILKRAIRWDDGKVSHEYEFKRGRTDEPFAQVGDFGALVFNLRKEWAGMLFAVDRSTGIGFVTPAWEIVRDIEERTG